MAQSNGSAPPQPGTIAPSVPAFTVRDKFEYRVVQSFGLKGFVGAGVGAAIGQALDTPGKWGEGAEGYSKRYVSGFAQNFSRQTMAFGMEVAFHEDPRYFPSTAKDFKSRVRSVVRQSYMTHTDSGREEFAYARYASAFGSAFLANAWQPSGNNSAADGLKRGMITIAADAGYSFLQEFFPFVRPRSIRNHQ